MSVLTMDMSSYEVDRSKTSGYGDEVLSAGWVPALVLDAGRVTTLALHEVHSEHLDVPATMAGMDVNAFLRKMYTSQR